MGASDYAHESALRLTMYAISSDVFSKFGMHALYPNLLGNR